MSFVEYVTVLPVCHFHWLAGRRLDAEYRVTLRDGSTAHVCEQHRFRYAEHTTLGEGKGVRLIAGQPLMLGEEPVNMWGTVKTFINAAEYCPECERENPHHYDSCPTRSAS